MTSKTKVPATTAALVVMLISAAAVSFAQLPNPGMEIDRKNTALLITDPQNDFLSPKGVTWGVVGKSVTENKTVEHIDALFEAAKGNGIPVFVSPHYYYPTDHGWRFEGALEALMHKIGMFDRQGALSLHSFNSSGADWLARYKPYIEDPATAVTSLHRVYGPETNDLVLQLRKRGVDRVILGGMSANLCTESHMRELPEQGFEVAVISDGYAAALLNFRFMANTVWTTAEAVKRMNSSTATDTQAVLPERAANFPLDNLKEIPYRLTRGNEREEI